MTTNNVLTRAKKRKALEFIQAQQFAQARDLLLEICRIDRRDVESWFLLGNTTSALGDQAGAEGQLRNALELAPNNAQIQYNLGNVLRLQKRFEEASDAFRKAIQLKPDYVMAYANMGASLHDAGKASEAIEAYRTAIQLVPNLFPAYLNLGQSLIELDRLDEALTAFESAIRIKSNDADALLGLGRCRLELNQPELAIEVLRSALAIKPEDAKILHLLGVAYLQNKEHEKALELIQNAVRLHPQNAGARVNMCLTLTILGHIDEAVEEYNELLELNGDLAAARYGLSELHLLCGNWKQGWDSYRWRWRFFGKDRKIPEIEPGAFTTTGKKVHMLYEQGLGDELFFLRFLQAPILRNKRVSYCAQAKIAPLIARSLPSISVTTDRSLPTDSDHTIYVGDLPYLTQMDQTMAVPPPVSLVPKPEHSRLMQARLAELGPPPFIGVTWRAGTFRERLLFKSSPTEKIAEVLRQCNATIVVLQRQPTDVELVSFRDVLGKPIHDLSQLNEDLENMLALLALLDDYVGVSNTNMHLRAGVGKTARVLVPNPPEWRWMASGDESPWFPGFRVYRQGTDMDWTPAFDKLAEDLAAAFPTRA